MKYYTEIQPRWLQWIVPDRFDDKELFRIVTFYVFHCPSENSSYMRKSLKEYGWNTPWRKPYKLNNQLKQVTNNEHLIYSSSTLKDMDVALEKAELDIDFPNFMIIKISGHNGNIGNELADSLSTNNLTKFQKFFNKVNENTDKETFFDLY